MNTRSAARIMIPIMLALVWTPVTGCTMLSGLGPLVSSTRECEPSIPLHTGSSANEYPVSCEAECCAVECTCAYDLGKAEPEPVVPARKLLWTGFDYQVSVPAFAHTAAEIPQQIYVVVSLSVDVDYLYSPPGTGSRSPPA